MTILNRVGRVLVVFSLVVIAIALSVNAAFLVLQYQQSEAFFGSASDRAVYTSDGGIRTESTTTITQTSIHISGHGSEPSEPVELLSEGLWIVSVRFADYEPPEVGNIPTVNLNSVSSTGGAGWSGDWWNHIYVSADKDWGEERAPIQWIATFTPGEVVLHISDLPDDVGWYADFERIGELQPEE
ncbi:MAG: hypothetical protein OXG33_04425 [Chloroflexi bacterium]|nr:hypothetical protein [Chloroflexota bacterium]